MVMNRNMSENEHSTCTTASTGGTTSSLSLSTQLATSPATFGKNSRPWFEQLTLMGPGKQTQEPPKPVNDENGKMSPLLQTPPRYPFESKAPQVKSTATTNAMFANSARGTPPSTLQEDNQAATATTIIAGPAEPVESIVPPTVPDFLADESIPKSSFLDQKRSVYSAIGSLEHCSAQSLKSMYDKNKQQQQRPGGNGFANYDPSTLLAPPMLSVLHNSKQEQQSSPPGNSQHQQSIFQDAQLGDPSRSQQLSSSQSTPDKFGDVRGQQEKAQQQQQIQQQQQQVPPTPGGIFHSEALKESLRTVQDKLDARNQQRHGQHSCRGAEVITKQTSMHPNATTTSSTVSGTNLTKKPRRSSMRKGRSSAAAADKDKKHSSVGKKNKSKSVTIDDASLQRKQRKAKKKGPVEMFRPSCDAYTPRMERKKIAYKPAEQRTPVQKMATTMGTLSRPNFRDALRRVAMLLRQHIVKIERRFHMQQLSTGDSEDGLFKMSMKDAFSEDKFVTCRYKCTMVRVPMARPGMVFGQKKIRPKYEIPTEEEIYEFAHQLFKTVQLSSECSIVCLIYIERLMEASKVPLLASTWKPIFMCGLLLASKVWQDLSSWNIEFASVYPQFSLDAINQLELQFLRMVKWDLYISSR